MQEVPPLSIGPVAYQAALRVIERTRIGAAVAPDIAGWAGEDLGLTGGQWPADGVLLAAPDAAHDPAIEAEGCAACVAQCHRLRDLVDSDDRHRVVWRDRRVGVGRTAVVAG